MCTTNEAARRAGVGIATLKRWIAQGKVKAPKLQRLSGVGVRIRLWTAKDISQLRKHKRDHLGEGAGRRTDLKGKQSQRRKKSATSARRMQ